MKSKLRILAFIGIAVFGASCDDNPLSRALGMADKDNDDTLLLAAAAYIYFNNCYTTTSTGSTITNSSATISNGCISGITTSMDAGLPNWIKNNFKCSVAFAQNGSYCFKSKNLPNATSPYWGVGATLYTATMPGTNAANPNKISSQSFAYAIPQTPTTNTGTLTGTQNGLSSIGITVNGLAMFNNAANPPDTLSTEAASFDSQGGHPESTGTYHHHANVTNGTGGTDLTAGTSLVGIALDGYAVYGEQCSGQGNAVPTDLDTYHGHTTTTSDFTTATYHYHYHLDSTAGIKTLLGSYFRGKIGSVSK